MASEPFVHLVIDRFAPPELIEDALVEMRAPAFSASEHWINYNHAPECKRGFSRRDALPGATRRLLTWCENVGGAVAVEQFGDTLLADPHLDGGGIHEMYNGGYLDVHADFLAHPVERTWRRRVNLLLYITPNWREEWGGQLELWDAARERYTHIVPTYNRAVLFATTATSWHGVTPLTCPPYVVRRSLALYYFSDEGVVQPTKPTHYVPRPSDSWTHRLALRVDRQMLKAYHLAKRYLGVRDEWVSRWMR